MDRTQNTRDVELNLVGSCNIWMRFVVVSMGYEVSTYNIPEHKESNFFTEHNFRCKYFVVLKFRKKVVGTQ